MLMLTSREKMLLRRLAQGKTDRKIAAEIGGQEDQIGLQRQRLIERLEIRSDEQLAARAKELAAWPVRTSHAIHASGRQQA